MIYGAIEKTFVLMCDTLTEDEKEKVRGIVNITSEDEEIEISENDIEELYKQGFISDELYKDIFDEIDITNYLLIF